MDCINCTGYDSETNVYTCGVIAGECLLTVPNGELCEVLFGKAGDPFEIKTLY